MAMRLIVGSVVVSATVAITSPLSGAQAPASAPKAKPRLGMNLNGPADWNTELPFVDVFRLSRRWISQRKGTGWGIMQHYDDDPAASPKFMATMRWARQCGQPVSLPRKP